MTPAEAESTAQRIHSSWPGQRQLSLETWVEELLELDYGTAGTALVRLRRDLDHPPTIARFLGAYRALHTVSNDPIPFQCRQCDGTGWVTRDYQAHGRTYRGAEPCRCRAGRDHERQYTEMLDARARRNPESQTADPPGQARLEL